MIYNERDASGYVMCHGINIGGSEITKERFDALEEAHTRIPERQDGKGIRLRADTLEWEIYDLPPEPPIDDDTEISDAQAIFVMNGGAL